MDRTEEIKRWIHLTNVLAKDEATLKGSLPERRRTVLTGKNLTVFEKLLGDAGHGDSDLVDQLSSSFDLTGSLPESQVFSRKVRPASISCSPVLPISAGKDCCRLSLPRVIDPKDLPPVLLLLEVWGQTEE